MASCPELRPQDRKRRYVVADFSQDGLPSLPSKKLKLTSQHPPARNFPPEFYDSLSKVRLTRRALRDLDRRNQLKSIICARAAVSKPVCQHSTQKELLRFARHGGPELGDLRRYPEPTSVKLVHTMSSKRSSHSSRSSSKRSKSTKSASSSTSNTNNSKGSKRRSSAYNEDFEQYLIDNSVYPEGYEYSDGRQSPEPGNLDDIRRRLALPRPSLSPSCFSDSAFRDFKRANTRVIHKGDVMREVLPTIYGRADIPHQEDLLFTRLNSITNEKTVDAKPDFYDGARLESIDKQVQLELGPYIIPTGHQTAPAAPNFFIEAKAPKCGADVVKRQITHDLSLGARGIHQLQSYSAGKPVYDNNTYTLGATYHNGQLMMYAAHPTQTVTGNSTEYHMSQLGGWTTIGSREQFIQGATYLRNGRDQAMEWRNQYISAANERVRYLEPSTLGSSNDSGISYTTDLYAANESQASVEHVATTSFATSLTATSFGYLVQEPNLPDITEGEEDEFSVDELALEMPPKPTRSNKGSEKTSSKASRHSTSTSHRKHHSRK